MIVVIIAGGSGTRLWPLSTPDYPKHLLKIQGESKSLLQNTYARAKWLSDKIYVVSEVGHIHHVKDQLPDLTDDSFIVEPARRGTASCILSALVRIGQLNSTDEPIVFLAADHYIRDVNGFAHSFKVAADASKRSGRIVLIGVEPDYPATGFGYIEKGTLLDEQSFIYNVNAFKEKPNYEVAQDYLKSQSMHSRKL
jgi:mannose-1-phosphate guanylyltransferase